ncbi:MAG: hypothetical protein AABZ60_24520 [Planctomycetota bacterium]
MTTESASMKLPDNFNPGIIDPLKRRKLWKTLLLSIIPGLGHLYTDQKRLAIAFFLVGISLFCSALRFNLPQEPYLIAVFEIILLTSAIQSTRSYLFRKRYKYLGGVHGWEYRTW